MLDFCVHNTVFIILMHLRVSLFAWNSIMKLQICSLPAKFHNHPMHGFDFASRGLPYGAGQGMEWFMINEIYDSIT